MTDDTALAAGHSQAIGRLLDPKSIAIVGMSARPGTAGYAVLRNLRVNEFAGDIHLIGRTAGDLDGLTIQPDLSALPLGVDVAVLTLPASGVGEALAGCADRGVGAAVVIASGFAEAGEEEGREQDRIARMVRDSALVVLGPNCIGYANHRVGFTVAFATVGRVPRLAPGVRGAVGIVGQSGGLANHVRLGLDARGVAVSYNVTTGNEMSLGLADIIGYLVDDDVTTVIVVYAETIRDPGKFLAVAAQARAAGKPIVMLHPGRSARAQEAAKSHTGAMTGDYAVMRAAVQRAGVVVVDSLDELLDVGEIFARYRDPAPGGMGILTFSGAFCSVAHDFCENIGVTLPPLAATTVAELGPRMPPHIAPRNPLDLGTQPIWQPELVGIGLQALLDDPSIAGVVMSIPAGAPEKMALYIEQIARARHASAKPIILAVLGDGSALDVGFVQKALDNQIVFSRSSDRSMRALADVLVRPVAREVGDVHENPIADLPLLTAGTQTEWVGKKLLATAGIAVPAGRLVHDVEQAVATAAEIGFPVVLKAQAQSLIHKTDAGGVVLDLKDAAAVREGWARLMAAIEQARPGLRLEGVLVEAMVERGLELVVGARRDPRWGPVIVVGLGGVFVEALEDVRLISADASQEEIVLELGKLKAALLLNGFRNMPAVDVEAAARAVGALGRLIAGAADVVEVEINPLMVHPRGRGATALDALVVTTAFEQEAN